MQCRGYKIVIFIAIFINILVVALVTWIFRKTKYLKEAVTQVMYNDLGCAKDSNGKCIRYLSNTPIPQKFTVEYMPNIAKFLCHLCVISYDTDYPVEEVHDIGGKIELELLNDDQTFIFGRIIKFPSFIVISLRGTVTSTEEFQDVNYNHRPLNFGEPPNVFVHAGFKNISLDLIKQIEKKRGMQKLLRSYPVYVTGHSLGASVAIIMAVWCKYQNITTATYTFATPKVGNDEFVDFVETIKLPVYRMTNTADVIPTLPWPVMPNVNDPSKPLVFTHCGSETLFQWNRGSLDMNHSITTYSQALAKGCCTDVTVFDHF